MPAAPQTGTSSTAPRPSAGRSMNNRKNLPYIIVGVGVVGYVLYTRYKAGKSTPAAAGTTVDPTAAAAAYQGSSNPDSAGSYQDMQGPDSTAPVVPDPTASPTPWKAPKGEKLVGSGYTSPPNTLLVTDSSGDIYQGIVSNISAGELKKAGEILYYQVLPGIFEPTKGRLRPGTSLFYKQKKAASA